MPVLIPDNGWLVAANFINIVLPVPDIARDGELIVWGQFRCCVEFSHVVFIYFVIEELDVIYFVRFTAMVGPIDLEYKVEIACIFLVRVNPQP